MDRRDFTKLSALALASMRVPASAQAPQPVAIPATPLSPTTLAPGQKPVGYAAIGLGSISEIFMRSVQATPQTSKITALVTGHPDDKGIKFAEMYGIPKSSIYTYETFDRIRDNKDVDAVYIGLPNSMHAEYTERAALAGKHVLCEKPMATTSAECRTMIDACRKANVKLMIAYRVHYDPTWMQVRDLIDSGKIGQVKSFRGAFLGTQRAGAWRLNKKLAGGGSLFDLGIYPLNEIRHITREEPNQFTATVSTRDKSGRFAEVEESIEWTMKFPSGIVASCGSSYGQAGPGALTISGDRGYIVCDNCFNYDGLVVHVHAGRDTMDIVSPLRAPGQFTLEAAHFADCVRNNKEPESGGEEGLKDLLLIEAIYKASAGTIV